MEKGHEKVAKGVEDTQVPTSLRLLDLSEREKGELKKENLPVT